MNLLDMALYNYFTDADKVGAVSEALENLMKSVFEHCGEKDGKAE